MPIKYCLVALFKQIIFNILFNGSKVTVKKIAFIFFKYKNNYLMALQTKLSLKDFRMLFRTLELKL